MRSFLLTLILMFVGCSCTSAKLKLDPQNAIEGNDLTALISGCGQQINSGYLVCRMIEGSTSNEYIYIHAPPNVDCDGDACTYFRIYFPDGKPTYEGVVKKGESFAKVAWSEIINKPKFDISDRGFYALSITLNFKDSFGNSRKTYADGYLFMHVVKKEYTSLLENERNEYFVWEWIAPTNQTVKMTTGFRVYVSSPQEESTTVSWQPLF